MKDELQYLGLGLLALWLMTAKPDAQAPVRTAPVEAAVPAPPPLIEAEPRALKVSAPKSMEQACENERELLCRRAGGSVQACLAKHRSALMTDCRKALNNTGRTAKARPAYH